MQFRIHRSDGKAGSYSQRERRRAEVLMQRFDPSSIFRSGPIVIGMLNPFTLLNPDEICWIELRTDLPTTKSIPEGVDQVRKLTDRGEYEAMLARQLPRWQQHIDDNRDDLLEALVEFDFRGGESLYLHATGRAVNLTLADAILGLPAITATFEPDGTLFINPKCIIRARVYYSKRRKQYPVGLWFAEADEI